MYCFLFKFLEKIVGTDKRKNLFDKINKNRQCKNKNTLKIVHNMKTNLYRPFLTSFFLCFNFNRYMNMIFSLENESKYNFIDFFSFKNNYII